eukprot:6551929-Lingulodinium_polyedra.AAC.1
MTRPMVTSEVCQARRPRSGDREETPSGRRVARRARSVGSELRRSFIRAVEAVTRERSAGTAPAPS